MGKGKILRVRPDVTEDRMQIHIDIDMKEDGIVTTILDFCDEEEFSGALAFWMMAKSLSDMTIGTAEELERGMKLENVNFSEFAKNIDTETLFDALDEARGIKKMSSPFFAMRNANS